MKRTITILTLAIFGIFALTGCTALENKAVAIGSGVDAFKIETSGSTSSGTILPNIIAGGAVNTLATAPVIEAGKSTQVVFVRSKRSSFFGELFGIDASTESISYIGAAGESSADTTARFEAFKKVIEAGKKTEETDSTASPAATEAETSATE